MVPEVIVFWEDITAAYICLICHAAENFSLGISLICSLTLPDDVDDTGIFGFIFNQKIFLERLFSFPKSYRQVVIWFKVRTTANNNGTFELSLVFEVRLKVFEVLLWRK